MVLANSENCFGELFTGSAWNKNRHRARMFIFTDSILWLRKEMVWLMYVVFTGVCKCIWRLFKEFCWQLSWSFSLMILGHIPLKVKMFVFWRFSLYLAYLISRTLYRKGHLSKSKTGSASRLTRKASRLFCWLWFSMCSNRLMLSWVYICEIKPVWSVFSSWGKIFSSLLARMAVYNL